jgi:hypothetical protein
MVLKWVCLRVVRMAVTLVAHWVGVKVSTMADNWVFLMVD